MSGFILILKVSALAKSSTNVWALTEFNKEIVTVRNQETNSGSWRDSSMTKRTCCFGKWLVLSTHVAAHQWGPDIIFWPLLATRHKLRCINKKITNQTNSVQELLYSLALSSAFIRDPHRICITGHRIIERLEEQTHSTEVRNIQTSHIWCAAWNKGGSDLPLERSNNKYRMAIEEHLQLSGLFHFERHSRFCPAVSQTKRHDQWLNQNQERPQKKHPGPVNRCCACGQWYCPQWFCHDLL